MDIELLKTFLEVNRTRHFGKAAENLFLTQSAVSARIRLLEENLSVSMFERQRNNLQLTPAGQRFLKYAKAIVASWQQARQEVALDEQFTASLSMGAHADLWEIFLLDLLVDLRRRQPHVAIQASAQSAELLTHQLLNHQIDLAFVFEMQFSHDLEHRFVQRIELQLFSTQSGQTTEQALAADFVMIDWGPAFAQQFAQRFPDCGPASVAFSHGTIALAYLQREAGSAYLPVAWGQSATLNAVEGAPVIKREVYAVWRSDNERVSVIEQVLTDHSVAAGGL